MYVRSFDVASSADLAFVELQFEMRYDPARLHQSNAPAVDGRARILHVRSTKGTCVGS